TTTAGMEAFRNILKDTHIYHILNTYLPTANGGILPAKNSQEALNELLLLEQSNTTEEWANLIEKSTGELIATTNIDDYFIFMFLAGNNHNYGINKDGFFIIENEKENDETISYIMFQSKQFMQHTLDENKVLFIDNETGKNYICSKEIRPYFTP